MGEKIASFEQYRKISNAFNLDVAKIFLSSNCLYRRELELYVRTYP